MNTTLKDFLGMLNLSNGVYRDGNVEYFKPFEKNYLELRDKEKRIISDGQLKQLPHLKIGPHQKEWSMRALSAKRVEKYFANQSSYHLLDLGCGNGWFSALLSQSEKKLVLGIDANLVELEQAARVFKDKNLFFAQGDIFTLKLPLNFFDFITLNAAIQYFEDFEKLMIRLFDLLKPNGEVHLIDSPVYKKEEIIQAGQRSLNYFGSQGFPEMEKFYFHHHWEKLSHWKYEVLYQPKQKNILNRIRRKNDIPFPWIKIKGRK